MKRLFKIYNRLTDISDHEYKFMVENKSKYIDKAKRIIHLLASQDVHLERLPDYDNSNEPDTGSGYVLAWSTEATVYDSISEEKPVERKIIFEDNYGVADVFVIAKILQELDEVEINESSKNAKQGE